MIIFTDDTEFAQEIATGAAGWDSTGPEWNDPCLGPLMHELYGPRMALSCHVPNDQWSNLFLTRRAMSSQYDMLIDLSRSDCRLPDRTLCLAAEGSGFHGFRNRAWAAPAGNIYLAVYLAPNRPIDNFVAAFMSLAAVSVVEAIDSFDSLRDKAGIKWVNDILIDGAKVCGVLAHTTTEGNSVSGAILGIGLNVNTPPVVEATSFVPKTTAMCEHVPESSLELSSVFLSLISCLYKNYSLMTEGNSRALIDKYRERSVLIGREVEIRSDSVYSGDDFVASGVVESVGENLELKLKGRSAPITSGRLILVE